MKPLSVIVFQNSSRNAESLAKSLYPHFRMVNVARDLNELRNSIPRHRADVAIVDLELAGLAAGRDNQVSVGNVYLFEVFALVKAEFSDKFAGVP